jgi:MFS family permease
MSHSLFASNPTFRRYWVARLASYAGDQIARTGLLIAVFEREGADALGLLLLASTAPRLFGPLLGAVADRFNQRRIMIGCDVAQAAIYLVIAVTSPSLPVLLALLALAAGFATLFTPASRCLVPQVVGAERIGAANARLAIATNAGLAAGPLLGGLLLAGTGLTVTLLVNAATFALSALLLAAPGFRLGEPARPSAERLGSVLREGVAVVRGNPVARSVSVMLLGGVVFAALDNVAVVPLGLATLHVSPAVVGALGTVYGLGMALAPMALTRGDTFRADRVLYVSLVAYAAGTLLTGVSWVIAVALLGQMVAGAGNGWQNVANDTLIQQHVPSVHLGTVFGTVYTFPYAAQVLAYAVGGPLLTLLGPRWLLGVAGTGVLLTLALGYPMLATATRRATGASPA